MRYESGSSLPDLVKTLPHIAFEVDDLEQALTGEEVLIEPNSPSEGVRVAFIVCDGAPVELLQYEKREDKGGGACAAHSTDLPGDTRSE
jgi:hypothetical protein